jgi:hypothetical protein
MRRAWRREPAEGISGWVYTAGVSQAGEIEEVDGVPVLVPEPAMRLRTRALGRSIAPSVQAAAVAAGGFVAGAAVAGLAHRRRGRDARALAKGTRGGRVAIGRVSGRRARRAAKAGEAVQIVGTRSLLVDVHLLGSVDGER